MVWTTCASACVRPAEVVGDNDRLLTERNIGFQTYSYAPGIQIFLLEKEDSHLWSPPYYVESIGVSKEQQDKILGIIHGVGRSEDV